MVDLPAVCQRYRKLKAPARKHSLHGFSRLVFREEVKEEANHSQSHFASADVYFCPPQRSCLCDVGLEATHSQSHLASAVVCFARHCAFVSVTSVCLIGKLTDVGLFKSAI